MKVALAFGKKIYSHFMHDSLYRNSIFLMLSTATMAFFGFFFWIINARLYTTQQVGIATTLLSVVSLITTFSMMGLSSGLIRYLPTSENKNRKINTVFSIVALSSIILSIGFIIFVKQFSPALVFIRGNVLFSLIFVLTIMFSSLQLVSDGIFIAFRSSQYVFMKNSLLSILKLLSTFAFVVFGAYGIFIATGFASTMAYIFVVLVLLWKFAYSPKLLIDGSIVKKMSKFSLGNYAAGLIGGLPSAILPIFIINNLGAKISAYFYMDLMIANLLFIIPQAVAQSLFAEGSYSEATLKDHLKKSAKMIALLLVPAVIITVVFGKYILLAFGKNYSTGGFTFLQLLAISSIFISINNIGNVISNVKHKIQYVVAMNSITTITTIGLSYLFIHNGLVGIGTAWIAGQAITAILYILIIKKFYY